jgi:hypothetical protein
LHLLRSVTYCFQNLVKAFAWFSAQANFIPYKNFLSIQKWFKEICIYNINMEIPNFSPEEQEEIIKYF